jgi:diguanylate cyclase (GGDEF)-like protein/PAS domain S-box-containing protein
MPNRTKTTPAEDSAAILERLSKLEATQVPPAETPWTGLERRAIAQTGATVALHESEKRYRRLFEAAKDGILILDADTGIVTDVNPYLTAMLGYSHAEIVGKAFWEFGPFRDTAATKSKFRQLQDVEYLRYDDLPLETRSHEIRHVEFVSNLYMVDSKRVIQCNIREITERLNAEDGARREHAEMAALVVALKERDAQMQALNRMNDLLQTCTVKEEAYKVITLMAGELFHTRSGAVAVLHPEELHLETIARWGTEFLMQPTFNIEDCWAMRRGQPHEVLNADEGLTCSHFIHQPEGGSLCLPLTVQGETLGLLTLTGIASADANARRNERQLAESMGEAIKLSLSNLQLREELKEQATHDSLTGLLNIRYVDENLPRELHRAARAGAPLTVAMLDLDRFKNLNDTLGHHAGDTMLREVGNVLRETLRKSDTAIRYGGEEFLLVLPDSSLADTIQRVQEICDLIRGIPIPDATPGVSPMTVSAGVATAGEHGGTAQELIRAADNALYSAKQAGRDRIVVYAA